MRLTLFTGNTHFPAWPDHVILNHLYFIGTQSVFKQLLLVASCLWLL
jgi:hypothetical protein